MMTETEVRQSVKELKDAIEQLQKEQDQLMENNEFDKARRIDSHLTSYHIQLGTLKRVLEIPVTE